MIAREGYLGPWSKTKKNWTYLHWFKSLYCLAIYSHHFLQSRALLSPACWKKAGSISHMRITNCTNWEKKRATCERILEGGHCHSVSFWKERIKAQLLNTQLQFALVYWGQDRPRQTCWELWIICNVDHQEETFVSVHADLSGNIYSFAASAAWLDWAAVLSNFL